MKITCKNWNNSFGFLLTLTNTVFLLFGIKKLLLLPISAWDEIEIMACPLVFTSFILKNFVGCICIDRFRWQKIVQRRIQVYLADIPDLFTDIWATWGKGFSQASNLPVYGQQYISHVGEMHKIYNIKLVGNSHFSLLGFHINIPRVRSFGFLQGGNSGSLTRKIKIFWLTSWKVRKHELSWLPQREDLKRCDATRQEGQLKLGVMYGENQTE